MKTENTLAQAAIAGLLALGLSASSGAAFAAADKEKCYGVAMAGKNDCGGKIFQACLRWYLDHRQGP